MSSDDSDVEVEDVRNEEKGFERLIIADSLTSVDELHLNLTDSEVKIRYLIQSKNSTYEFEAQFQDDDSDDRAIKKFWRRATRNLEILQGIEKLYVTVESDGCDDLESYRRHEGRRTEVFLRFHSFLKKLPQRLSVFDIFFTFETPEEVALVIPRLEPTNICTIKLHYNERSLEREDLYQLNMVSTIDNHVFQDGEKFRSKNLIFPWNEYRCFSKFNDAKVCFHGQFSDFHLMDLKDKLLQNNDLKMLQINCPPGAPFDENLIDRLREKYQTDSKNWTYFSYQVFGKLGMYLDYERIVFHGPRYTDKNNKYCEDTDMEEEAEEDPEDVRRCRKMLESGTVELLGKLPDNIDMILADLYIEEQFPELFLKKY